MKDLHSQRYLVEEGALSIWKGLSGQVLLWGTAEMFMGRWEGSAPGSSLSTRCELHSCRSALVLMLTHEQTHEI